MKFWNSLSTLFKVSSVAAAQQTTVQRENRKHQAYQAVFNLGERGTDEHKEIVAADLLNFCGHMVPRDAATYTTQQLWQEEGKRQVAIYILNLLNLPETDLRALEQAARREAVVTDLDRSQENEGLDFNA